MTARRNKNPGIALLLTGMTLCGTGLWLLLNPSLYRATAKINIKAMDFSNLAVEDEYIARHRGGWFDGYWTPATIEYIKSARILTNVVETLHIDEEWKKQRGVRALKISTEELLRQRTEVLPIGNTPIQSSDIIVAITVTDSSPDGAAMIANTIAKAYQDYREAQRQPFAVAGNQAMTRQLQTGAEKIKIKQDYLEQLRKQLNLPKPEPAEELIKSNYPTYFQAKQELQDLLLFQKLLTSKIESDKAELQHPEPKHSFVEIVSLAQASKSSAGHNHLFGMVAFVVGVIFFLCGGWQLARARRC